MKPAQYKQLLKKASRSQSKPRLPKVRPLPVFGRMTLTRGQEKALDTLWAQAVKARASGKCEMCCQKKETLQAHHVIGRRNKTLRHVVSNGCSLCPAHHMYAEQNGVAFAKWIIEKRGEEWWTALESLGRELKCFKDYTVIHAYLESFL